MTKSSRLGGLRSTRMTRIDSVGEATWTGARVARRARPRDCPASVTCPAAPAALEPVGSALSRAGGVRGSRIGLSPSVSPRSVLYYTFNTAGRVTSPSEPR